MKKEDKPYTNGFDPDGFETFKNEKDQAAYDKFIEELLRSQIKEIYKYFEEDEDDE